MPQKSQYCVGVEVPVPVPVVEVEALQLRPTFTSFPQTTVVVSLEATFPYPVPASLRATQV